MKLEAFSFFRVVFLWPVFSPLWCIRHCFVVSAFQDPLSPSLSLSVLAHAMFRTRNLCVDIFMFDVDIFIIHSFTLSVCLPTHLSLPLCLSTPLFCLPVYLSVCLCLSVSVCLPVSVSLSLPLSLSLSSICLSLSLCLCVCLSLAPNNSNKNNIPPVSDRFSELFTLRLLPSVSYIPLSVCLSVFLSVCLSLSSSLPPNFLFLPSPSPLSGVRFAGR